MFTGAGNEMSGNIVTITRANVYNTSFVIAGDKTFKLWHIDAKNRKLYGTDVKVGKIRRAINCLVIDETDENIYCGTTSGDIIQAKLFLSYTLSFFYKNLIIKLVKFHFFRIG